MLVNSKKMLEEAKAGHYAVPAANIVNLENIKGVIEAAEETKHPLMVCLAEVHTPTLGIEEAAAIVKYYAQKSNQDIALHYDHGFTIDLVKKAIDAGFTSVMIDGSQYSFKENIELTKKVVDYAHERGVVVEGELGQLAGVEDDVNVEHHSYTKPEEVEEFVSKTGVDSLAIAIGTSHGAFKFKPGTKPQLRFDILEEVSKRLPEFPIVLHGASSVSAKYVDIINSNGGKLKDAVGIPEDMLRKAAKSSVCKINIDSDIRLAMTAGVREALVENEDMFDPRVYLKQGRAYVKELVEHKMINVLGSNGKA